MRPLYLFLCLAGYLGYTSGFSLSCMVFFLSAVNLSGYARTQDGFGTFSNVNSSERLLFCYIITKPQQRFKMIPESKECALCLSIKPM